MNKIAKELIAISKLLKECETTKEASFKDLVRKAQDRIPGGLADLKQPMDFNQRQLLQGIKVEMEHTSDPEIAREIAMDHLTEDARYYDKLSLIEPEHTASTKIAKTDDEKNNEIFSKLDRHLEKYQDFVEKLDKSKPRTDALKAIHALTKAYVLLDSSLRSDYGKQ